MPHKIIALGCYAAAAGASRVGLRGTARRARKLGRLFDLASLARELEHVRRRYGNAEATAIRLDLEREELAP